ncbi:hypothetical protein ABZ016_03190 [Streptomyces sp. NPDC006372]|uniref:hypothetical protein n=1 Tax=Streptomyces sp. NPDC006372 TaxID=3155599 RepID=UPI0033A483C2
MDAGLAAIIGAAGAAVATVSAALAAAAAQRRAARVSATAEQRKKVHDTRSRVYEEFILAVNDFYRAISRVQWDDRTWFDGEIESSVGDALTQAKRRCNESLSEMWIVTPNRLFRRAVEISEYCDTLHLLYVRTSLEWHMARDDEEANKKGCARLSRRVKKLGKKGFRFSKAAKRLLAVD